MPDTYSELMLRFEPPREANGPYVVEAMVDGMGLWTGGRISLSSLALEGPTSPREYGVNLWEALTNQTSGWKDLPGIFGKAWGSGGQRIRLRLMLDVTQPDLHRIKWELLVPDQDSVPVGVNPLRPTSRFLPLPNFTAKTSGAGLKILLAIANPSDLKPPLEAIDVEGEVSNILDVLQASIRNGQVALTVLPGRTLLSDKLLARLAAANCTPIAGAATAESIGRELSGKHALHLVAHGDFKREEAILHLENVAGEQDLPKTAEIVKQWADALPRLIFLQSCRSDPEDRILPAAGLAPSFVMAGVTAVVAMRDYVGMEAARNFAAGFYRQLLDTGEVDVAVNAGRNATYKLKNDYWSIPILYSRLRSGERLWDPDPLRQGIQAMADKLRDSPEVRQPFPVEVSVVKNVNAVRQELDQPTSTACIDAIAAARHELGSESPLSKLTVLLGGRGRAKSSLLRALFVDLADSAAAKNTSRPILLRLGDCTGAFDDISALDNAWSATLKSQDIERGKVSGQLKTDPLYLLVDGDDDIGEQDVQEAIARIKRIVMASNRSALISMDESAFVPTDFDPERTTVLIVQDLRAEALRNYLERYVRPNGELGFAPEITARLTGPLRDLAGIPWLLGRIVELAELDPANLQSRFKVLERIVRERLGLLTSVPGGRMLARNVMREMAWRLHSRRALRLSLAETYTLLSTSRGMRDFGLDAFRKDLLSCKLLMISGPEGVRFAYSAAHSYFTACYLNSLSGAERQEQLKEIVAGLGRPDRLRAWEEVLLLLAGLMEQPDQLVRYLVDLGFGAGEHLLLAARSVHEARSAMKTVDGALVSQLTESLIWWSSPRSGLDARSRRRAVEAFGYLLTDPSTDCAPVNSGDAATPKTAGPPLCESENWKRIIFHLLHVVLDSVRVDETGQCKLDYSNVRLEALSLMFRHQEVTLRHLNDASSQPSHGFEDSQVKDIVAFIETWKKGQIAEIAGYLTEEKNPVLAGLAAFALITLGGDDAMRLLLARFRALPIQDDLHWLMIDALTELRSADAIKLIHCIVEEPASMNPALTKYVVYAIGKIGSALAGSKEMEFLESQLKCDEPQLQALSLRAYAELLGSAMDQRTKDLRNVCHAILGREFSKAQSLLQANKDRKLNPKDRLFLTRYTLDALRHIGDAESLVALREFYLHQRMRTRTHTRNPCGKAVGKLPKPSGSG